MKPTHRPLLLLFLLLLAPVLRAEEEDPLEDARTAYELRDHRVAERLLLVRLADDGEDIEAWKLLAEVYLRIGNGAAAARAIEKGQEIAPADPYLRVTAWEARLTEEDWSEEVRAEVREAIDGYATSLPEEGATKDELLAAWLGYSLLDDDDGKERFRERLLALPGDPPEEIEGDLLEAVIVSRDPEERVRLIDTFLAHFPHSKQANYLREILLWVLREDREKLLAAAEAILEEQPENRRVRAALARWLLDTEPVEAGKALAHLYAALEFLDGPQEIDRPELASDEDFSRMLEETRGRYETLLGRALVLLGKPADARPFLRRAIDRGAGADAWFFLGEAEAVLGNEEEALAAFTHALAGGSEEARERLFAQLPKDAADLRSWLGDRLPPAPRFVDATQESGLARARGSRFAFGDFDGDGDPDLLSGGHQLFVNQGDGIFSLASADTFPKFPGTRGGLFADFDNDRDLDVLLFRTNHPVFLENRDGRFTDRTPEGLKDDARWISESATVFDFDGDGLLDVYLANYERPPFPPYARGTPDRLLRNEGEFKFVDASDRITGVSAEPMCGRGTAAADFDGDGDTDLFVANYRLDPDFLIVAGEEGLANRARALGVEGECDRGYFGHGIGPAFGDLDGDGDLDLVVANLAHPRYIGFSDVTRVFLQAEDGTFRDTFRESGIRYEETHSNLNLADVDLDGDLDLFLTSVYRGRKAFLYLNEGDATFRDATWLAGVGIDNGWGAAFADVDLDGDLDLITRDDREVRLLRNDGPAGAFLGLTLVGREKNGAAVGARVTAILADGTTILREIGAGSGTGCQDDASLRFGVGEGKGAVDLEIRWPGGRLQRIGGLTVNRIYTLVEGGNVREIGR